MSASTVIGDITHTLEELLKNAQQPSNLFTVSLKSPAEETIETTKPKVNLFLFRVTENPFSKSQDWEAVGTEGLRFPPLSLNLFYVLTPFAEDKLDEHRVLGEAMRIFHDHAIIQAPLLKGVLEHSTEELKIDLSQLTMEELSRIWTALTKPYRLSVCYEVRLAIIDSAIERAVRRVTEKEEQYSQLGGR